MSQHSTTHPAEHSTTHPAAFNSYSHGVAHPKGHELAVPPAGGDVATFPGGGLGSSLMAPGVFAALSKAMPFLACDIYEADAGLFYDFALPGAKKVRRLYPSPPGVIFLTPHAPLPIPAQEYIALFVETNPTGTYLT